MDGVLKDRNIFKIPKLDLIVIRFNKHGEPCNSRPCFNCVDMMKAVGIRKVFYSVSPTQIICENVKDMVSINSSSTTKRLEKIIYGNPYTENSEQFFEYLLKKKFPAQIKYYNLDLFIKHNLLDVLPNYKIKIIKEKNNKFVWILNSLNILITKALIY